MTQRVHIEFQRVQTWLFAVPRLRAMVGANALLGETLRVALPELARNAAEWTLATDAASYPHACKDDPLASHDDPSADARAGILARDGGHFEAQFTNGGEAFAAAAGRLLRRKLPDMRFRMSIDHVPQPGSQVRIPIELPVLAPCEWAGGGLASVPIVQGDRRREVSLDVEHRHRAARRAEGGSAQDLASLLTAATRLKEFERPQELPDLVGSGYLALVHADGNGVGRNAGKDDGERARFFHRNRVLLRRALQTAINSVCEGETGLAPLILLMLGGDDLLFVCRAAIALPIVLKLCDALAALQTDTGDFDLTLGVGVVFSKSTIPMYRLHEVAEQLAGSAKRRYRGLIETGAKGRSVVDWAVYSTAWVDDPEDVRRRDWLRGEGKNMRVLSQRPVDVLGGGLGTLEGLLNSAENLKQAPRSQLRYLVDQLPRGHALADLAFAELSKEAREALENAGVKTPWQRAQESGAWLTPLLDLVEILEIERLGSSAGAHTACVGETQKESTHG